MYGISLSNSSYIDIAWNSITGNTNEIVFYSEDRDIYVFYNSICPNYNGSLNYSGEYNNFVQNNFITNQNLQASDADHNNWR